MKIISFLKNNYLFICLFIAFIFLFYLFYPGTVAYDSLFVYHQAYYNLIGNWHSALISRFWQLILSFTDIRGIFVLPQLICIFVGLYLIAKNISKGILTGIICILILFLPPVFSLLFTVLKDTYLAAIIFIISAAMFDYSISKKRKMLLFVLLCSIFLIFCFYIRANGCFIAAPLLVALLIGWKKPIIYRYILSLFIVLCVIGTTSFVDLKLLKAKDEAPDFSLMLFDIIGTAKNSGQTTLPDIPEVPDQITFAKKCYTPLQWDSLSFGKPADGCGAIAIRYYKEFLYTGDIRDIERARKELRKAWVAAITQHPLSYLKHRISHFNRFLNYQGHRPSYWPIYSKIIGFVQFGDKDSPITYMRKDPPKIWGIFTNLKLENQIWFNPYISLLILLFFYLSTLSTRDQFNRTLNVVSFSGLIYLVGFLFVGVSAGFRYSYPSLLLSILCVLAAFAFYSQKREIFGTKKTRLIAASVTIPLFLIGIIL